MQLVLFNDQSELLQDWQSAIDAVSTLTSSAGWRWRLLNSGHTRTSSTCTGCKTAVAVDLPVATFHRCVLPCADAVARTTYTQKQQ